MAFADNNAARWETTARRPVKVLELGGHPGRLGTILCRLLAFAIFAGLWQWGAISAGSILIPSFTRTMEALWKITVTTGEIWPALWISNKPLIVGYIVSVIISVPLGLAMARWKALDRTLDPITAVALALPIAPLVPIVLVAMGMGLTPKIFIIVLFSWVFILTNVRAGTRRVDRSLIEMARSFGASEREVWTRILLPGAVPAVFAGLRIGLGRAFAGMIIVELIMLPMGVGALLLDYRGDFKAAELYATIIVVVLEAVLLAVVMQKLERDLIKWK